MDNRKQVILAVNPGSTSIKLALYRGEEPIATHNLKVHHLMDIVNDFQNYEMTRDSEPVQLILSWLAEQGVSEEELGIVVCRAGPAQPMHAGAYEINQLYVDNFRYNTKLPHPAIMGPAIIREITKPLGIPAITYDSDSVDEADEMEHVTGLPEMRRPITCHNLNGRMMSHALAKQLGKPYEECRFIVLHMGGGISVCAHRDGRVVDSVFIDEGPMTPTRTGNLPTRLLIDLCYSGKYTYKEMSRFAITNGGLTAYFGTSDALAVEKMVLAGDPKAAMVYKAMAYQTSKCIGQMAVVLKGEVDALLITGAMAHSQMLVDWIAEWTGHIAPVHVFPGEDEMKALCMGAYRALSGQEGISKYDIVPDNFESIEAFYDHYSIPVRT